MQSCPTYMSGIFTNDLAYVGKMDSSNDTNLLSVESNAATSGRPLVMKAVELNEDDIPGAHLSEPFESHNVQALKWWLLCHGIRALSTWKKSNLISG